MCNFPNDRAGDIILKGICHQMAKFGKTGRSLSILGSWVESRHVGSFGELGRAGRTTRHFTEVPLLTFNSMPNKYLGFVTFIEKVDVVESTWRLDESPS
ncbi:hypothetical protein MTR67_048286 [Solanum verrucosum]|uniref:Uncharacterized protein n=1 Tax=Solanum verrucosum TaxID=315347 RepID=A0AAF0ZX83_SOLVR|nr:hypothetical protein MTR67_048286 [Solanum verrucosum]